jgi:hypothetical protein
LFDFTKPWPGRVKADQVRAIQAYVLSRAADSAKTAEQSTK